MTASAITTHPNSDGAMSTKATWRQKIHAITELPDQVKTVSVIAGITFCIAIIALAVAIAAYAQNTKATPNAN